VTNKHVIFDPDTFTDKRMARDLHVFTNNRILLNLDECADLAVVANRAAVKVDESEDAYVFTETHVRSDPAKFSAGSM
jgi:hypothetical protein